MEAETVQRIREAFQDVRSENQLLKKRIEKLEKVIIGHATLLVDLRGQEAYDLHTSVNEKEL